MTGVVFLGDRKLELREFPDPTPGPRDVILEIKASGMCGSSRRAPGQAVVVSAAASGPTSFATCGRTSVANRSSVSIIPSAESMTVSSTT